MDLDKIKTNWKDLIEKYPNLDEIRLFLKKESETFQGFLEIYPPKDAILRCFKYFNIEETKVVILGQDPYHGPNQATGLCFGVDDSLKTPPSLKNIQKELKNDRNMKLETLTLENWAKQGILLLNSALTVRQKTPTSHMKIWLPFTKYIIDYLNQHCSGIVFVAWGAFAYDKLKNINLEKHHLLVSSHPSPFSANRMFRKFPSFIGSKPFTEIDNIIQTKILWGEN